MNTYQRPDGTPKKTGARLYNSIARVLVHEAVSGNTYRVQVEHPEHAGGVSSFLRTSREMVVSAVKSQLADTIDTDVARVEVVDGAELGLSEAELLPDVFERSGPFAPETPEVEVSA